MRACQYGSGLIPTPLGVVNISYLYKDKTPAGGEGMQKQRGGERKVNGRHTDRIHSIITLPLEISIGAHVQSYVDRALVNGCVRMEIVDDSCEVCKWEGAGDDHRVVEGDGGSGAGGGGGDGSS